MQVVVVEWEERGYGTSVYTEDPVDLITFDFSLYSDEVPSLHKLEQVFRKQIDKIIIPEARARLEDWYKENHEWAEDIERPNEIEQQNQDDEAIQEAKLLLERQGYTVEAP